MENHGLENFNQVNIDVVERELENSSDALFEKAYTMIQSNSYHDVKITEESRKECIKSLIRR